MKITSEYKIIPKLIFLKFLFYIFPILMFTSSGFINAYIFLFIIYSLYFFLSNKIRIDMSILDYLILLFFLISIFSSLLNISNIADFNVGGKKFNLEIPIFLKAFFNLRFVAIYIIFRNIIEKRLVNIKILFNISLICSIFLSFDIFLQHYRGFDIFGFPIFEGRYNGLFEHEAIAGSYLQKFFIISILAIFLLRIENNIKFFLFFFSINIIGMGILLSLDRMPYLVFILNILILAFVINNFRINFFLCFISTIFIFLVFFINYSPVKNRYVILPGQFEFTKIKNFFSNENKLLISSPQIDNNELSSGYLKIYYTSLNVFLKNIVIGSGLKSFPYECDKLKKYDIKNLSCSTHTHNLYLEILVSQGIAGLSVFFIFLYLLLKKKYLEIFLKETTIENKFINIFFFTILICELIPFRSYGNIFGTISGTIFWFLLSITSCNLQSKKF